MRITIGLTTWNEHPVLINNIRRQTTLAEYAQHFPVVEIDTFFYALPTLSSIQKWQKVVAPGFQFIVKVPAAMTGHRKAGIDLHTLFNNFKEVIRPLVVTNQLKVILFQFPPYFRAVWENIAYLHRIRVWLGCLPVAIEVRNRSWYRPKAIKTLVECCHKLNFTLVAADEPNQIQASVPFYLVTTTSCLTLLRLHGRNCFGWSNANSKNWRKQRTLYHYSKEELAIFQRVIENQQPKPLETCVIFNNNSGGDAAVNAVQLTEMMKLRFSGLLPPSPRQTELF